MARKTKSKPKLHECICRICGQIFMSQRTFANTCKDNECQLERKRRHQKEKYARRKLGIFKKPKELVYRPLLICDHLHIINEVRNGVFVATIAKETNRPVWQIYESLEYSIPKGNEAVRLEYVRQRDDPYSHLNTTIWLKANKDKTLEDYRRVVDADRLHKTRTNGAYNVDI